MQNVQLFLFQTQQLFVSREQSENLGGSLLYPSPLCFPSGSLFQHYWTPISWLTFTFHEERNVSSCTERKKKAKTCGILQVFTSQLLSCDEGENKPTRYFCDFHSDSELSTDREIFFHGPLPSPPLLTCICVCVCVLLRQQVCVQVGRSQH